MAVRAAAGALRREEEREKPREEKGKERKRSLMVDRKPQGS